MLLGLMTVAIGIMIYVDYLRLASAGGDDTTDLYYHRYRLAHTCL
jgi:hypothetical protein